MHSLADLDVDKLSGSARTALTAVQRIENHGEPPATVLAELGMSDADYQAAVQQLAQEWARQGGAVELPPLTSEEYSALRNSISLSGQWYPILRGPDGSIIDGKHRLRACRELGREPWFRDVDGTAEELESLALVVNLARRQLTPGARRGIVKAELLRDHERSDRAIATAVGVSPTTVGSVRQELEQAGEVSKLDTRRDRHGVTRPAAQPEREPRSTPPTNRSDGHIVVSLLIAPEIAAQVDGSWIECKAFQLSLVEPGVYSLQVRT